MIVERHTFQIKNGHMEEALALLAEQRNISPLKDHIRHYSSLFGDIGLVASEFEFADLAQQAAFWRE